MTPNYQPLPNLNILPREYRWRLLTGLQMVLIVALVLGILLGNELYTNRTNSRSQLDSLQREVGLLEAETAELLPGVEKTDKTRQEIKALQGRLEKLEGIQAYLQANQVDWEGLLSQLFVEPPQGIELLSVEKESTSITMEGVSSSGYPMVVQYYRQLETAPGVAHVSINQTEVRVNPDNQEFLSFNITVTLQTE